jgi:phosphodiesterase/alkaline phosphatase D-like protein
MNGNYLQGDTTGRFRTSKTGVFSFQFGAGSCHQTNTNDVIFDAIRSGNYLFFIQHGDFHYRDLTTNNINAFRTGYTGFFSQTRPSGLYRSLPHYYIYDDHDYCGNDSDRTAAARNACISGYREFVPHPPLADAASTGSCYYSFAIGRCLFVVTDLRSARNPNSDTDNSSKSMMGGTQKTWFKRVVNDARGQYPIIFWVCSVNWHDTSTDAWQGFTTERAELADFFYSSGVSGLIMLHGDMHCNAADDGQNTDFRTGGSTSGFCSICSAPMDQSASVRSTWSQGTYSATDSYGKFIVTDGGPIIQVDYEGKDNTNRTVVRLGTTNLDTPRNGKWHRIQLGKAKII